MALPALGLAGLEQVRDLVLHRGQLGLGAVQSLLPDRHERLVVPAQDRLDLGGLGVGQLEPALQLVGHASGQHLAFADGPAHALLHEEEGRARAGRGARPEDDQGQHERGPGAE